MPAGRACAGCMVVVASLLGALALAHADEPALAQEVHDLGSDDGAAVANWLISHLPITLSITAAGAAMVSLIGHADDPRTPAGTAWLLSSAVALGLLALVVTARSLVDADRLAVVYQPLTMALVGGSGGALLAGWLRPAPCSTPVTGPHSCWISATAASTSAGTVTSARR